MDIQNRSVTLPRMGTVATENQSVRNNNYNNNNSRPVSFYDNIRENGQEYQNCNESSYRNSIELQELRLDKEKSPTQVPLMNTTVPQNIGGGLNLGDRHEPTRNSLRHSRMIVMCRNGNVPKKYLPPIIRYHRLAKTLVGLQTLLGFLLTILSAWLLLWTPNLRQRDNPYWSGIPLLLSGIFGLGLLCCFKKEYPGMPNGYFVYSVKVLSVFLSTVAGAVCLIGFVFTIIHLISLSTMACTPLNQVNTTCYCKVESSNDTTALPAKSYHYVDLNCPEVHILNFLVIFSCGTNGMGGIIALWYIYLHWSSRYSYTYSKVRTKENRPVIINNNT